MDYLQLIAEKPPEKAALITEEHTYTYGELAALARERRKTAGGARRVYFIKKSAIAQQLIEFIAFAGTDNVPVLAPQEADTEHLKDIVPPPEACMGAMTSGTTGRDKVLFRTYESWAGFFEEQNRVFGVTPDSCMFAQGSLAFTGNLNLYMGALYAGASVTAAGKFRPRLWQEMILKYSCDVVYLIPTKLRLLARVLPNAEMTLYYGASELNYITYIKDCEMTGDRTLIGRPFKGVGVSVRDGEIYIDTKFHVTGVKCPATLGDCGSIDENGMLHFLGRRDDMYNINGIKVSGLKVESALLDCGGVEDAAALAEKSGGKDLLTVFVVGRGLNKTGLLQKLHGKLTEHELPKRIIFIDALPKNESGKTDRKRLSLILETCK